MFDIRKKSHRVFIKFFAVFISFLLIHSVASSSKTIVEELFQYIVFMFSVVFLLWHPVRRPINKIILNENKLASYSLSLLGLTFLIFFSLCVFFIIVSGAIDCFNNKASVFLVATEMLKFFSRSEIYMGATVVWLLVSALKADIETKDRILNFVFSHADRVQMYRVNEDSDGVNLDIYFFGKEFKSAVKNKKAIQLIEILKNKNVSTVN